MGSDSNAFPVSAPRIRHENSDMKWPIFGTKDEVNWLFGRSWEFSIFSKQKKCLQRSYIFINCDHQHEKLPKELFVDQVMHARFITYSREGSIKQEVSSSRSEDFSSNPSDIFVFSWVASVGLSEISDRSINSFSYITPNSDHNSTQFLYT